MEAKLENVNAEEVTAGPPDGVERAWVLVQAPLSSDDELVEVAAKIVTEFAVAEDAPDDPEIVPPVAVRADVTYGPVRMIVPIFADSLLELRAMLEVIEMHLEELADASYSVARIAVHVPQNTLLTPGYVTAGEAFNPGKGLKKPTGANMWG